MMTDLKERDMAAQQQQSPPSRLKEIASTSGPWLHAWYDPMAHLLTTSSRIATVDITNDGNHALLVVDDSKRLKVFRGMNLISSHKLLDSASCLSVFHPNSLNKSGANIKANNNSKPTKSNLSSLPAVGVGTGSYIYIYRSMRPYFKFTLPTIPINSEELNIWNLCKDSDITLEETLNLLMALETEMKSNENKNKNKPMIELTFRTMFVLSITDRAEQLKYIESYKSSELIKNTCITCMAAINKEDIEYNAISSLIIGTENNEIVFLDCSGCAIEKQIRIPSVPFILSVIGLLAIDYRVIIATRASKIYTIRNGKLLGNHIELESNITAMAAFNKNIIVSCLNKTLYSYHIKGNNVKLWSLYFKHNITAIEPMIGNKFQGENAFLVGFENGSVAMYKDNVRIHLLQLDKSAITALKFGKYGREECTLIVLNQNGCLNMKIMSRRCDINKIRNDTHKMVSKEQEIPLSLPPITQLYLDQEMREKENAQTMHKIWQKEIVKFRLKTNKQYIETLKKNINPSQSINQSNNVSLNVKVIGLGPWFTLQITLKNIGKEYISFIAIILMFDNTYYSILKPILKVPLLIPLQNYMYNIKVKCIEENGNSNPIRLAVINDMQANHEKNGHFPFMTAIVEMPYADMEE